MQPDVVQSPDLASPKPASKAMIWTGRIISGLMVAFMLMDAVMKSAKPAFVVEGTVKLGIPEHTIVGIGVALLVSTLLYAIPATSVLGAILLTGYLGGAIMTHVRVDDPPFTIVFAFLFGVVAWLGIFFREPRLRALIPFRRKA